MWLREGSKFGAASPLLVVCGTKGDLAGRRAVTKAEAETWCSSRRYDYFEASALGGQGVSQLFEAVVARVF
jgi:hypothetical protein